MWHRNRVIERDVQLLFLSQMLLRKRLTGGLPHNASIHCALRQLLDYVDCFSRIDLDQYGATRLRAIVAGCPVVVTIGKTQILLQTLRFSLLLIIVRDNFAAAA
jgi:hypothetical protein